MYHIARNAKTKWGVHLRPNAPICTLTCLNARHRDGLHHRRHKNDIFGKSHWRTLSYASHNSLNNFPLYKNSFLNSCTIININKRLNLSSVEFTCSLHTSALLYNPDDVKEKLNIDLDDKSKVEEYVEHQKQKLEKSRKLLAAREKLHNAYIFKPVPDFQRAAATAAAPQPTAVVVKKKTIPQRIMKELNHYYKGFKLLYLDTKIAARLLWGIMNGKSLSRRERKQFLRTVADLFRLVPFMVFLIIPFMEFLLPVAIKLFPGMLPSTFEDKKSREDKRRLSAKMRLKMAEFLQDTIEEISVSSQQTEKANPKLKEFARFINKTRTDLDPPSNIDIIKYSKIFEDEITLDNIPYDQLKALCLIMMISPIGTGNFIRFKLRLKLQELKADDQMIRMEGVDALSNEELQNACVQRGMRSVGVTIDRMREGLNQWLELSLDREIPASLLLLSRTLYIQNTNVDEQLKLTISQFPERLIDEMELKIGAVEGETVDRQTIIDILKHEEEQIKSENMEREKEMCEEEKRKQKELLEEKIVPNKLFKEELLKVKETLSVSEKEKLLEIKEERKEYIEDVEELKLVPKIAKENVASSRLGKRIDAILTKVDKSLQKLDDGLVQKIDEDEDGIVTTHELSEAISKLQNAPDEEKTKQLLEIIDDDRDGVIDLNEMRIAVKLLANEELADLNQEQIQEVLLLIRKSEKVFLLEQLLNKRKSNYLIGLVPAAGKKAENIEP